MRPLKMLQAFTERVAIGQTKPMTGFIRDMLYGIATGRSTMLSEIGRALGEDADLITTEMRLSRNLANTNLRDSSMRKLYLQTVRPYIEDAVVALDFSEIRKEYSEKQEWLCGIWDDSRGEKARGYWLLNIEAIDGKGRHFPLWLEPFSQNAPEYKSQAKTVEDGIRQVRQYAGDRCIWVLDRGFDGASYIGILEANRLTYCVRQVGKRRVIGEDGRPALTAELAATVDTPHMGRWRVVRKGREYPTFFHYGSCLVTFPQDGKQRRLIVVRTGSQRPLMLLTNELSAKPAAILWVVIAYFKRWGVEEGTRLVKQIFDLENVRAMSFAGIRRVVLFAYLAYGFLCLFARRAGKAAVRAVLRLYKSFMPDAPPHYIYYRLACAVAVALMRAGP